MDDEEKRRRLKKLTAMEHKALEVLCEHKKLQLQEIAAQGLIKKRNGQPIKYRTLIAYNQKLYRKLGIESRDRRELEREYCRLLEGEDGGEDDGEVPRQPAKKLVLLFTSLAVILLIILAVFIFGPEPSPSISCENLELAYEIFPQAEEVGLPVQPFSDKEHPGVFRCEVVQDNTSLYVHLAFEDVGDPHQFGYFGIGGFNGSDISFYNELCIQAYARQPQQRFWMNLKDVYAPSEGGGDIGFVVELTEDHVWEEKCIALQEYKDEGLDLVHLENVNFGFDNRTGTGEIWIGSLEFR